MSVFETMVIVIAFATLIVTIIDHKNRPPFVYQASEVYSLLALTPLEGGAIYC